MDTFNQDLFSALDMAVFESKDGESFQFIGKIPTWFAEFYPELEEINVSLKIGHKFLFLAHFLSDAQDFWKNKSHGRLKSGNWMETGKDGRIYQIEAVALYMQGKKILVLESGNYSSHEKKYLLSRGNALSFDYKMLKAFEHHEAEIRADVQNKMESKYQELKKENESLKLKLESMKKSK